MICPNCSANFDDNMRFCPDCGTPVNNTNAYQNPNVYQQTGYQQNSPFASMPYSGNIYPPETQEKNPTMWQYVGWMLLGTIFGPISLVISIIFACSSENKPRATFFKAHLIVMVAAAVVSIIAIVAVVISGVTLFGFSDAPVVESFGYEFYEEMLRIVSLIR